MDLGDSPAEAAFRAELRGWIEANCPDELRGGDARDQHAFEAASRRWLGTLARAGYAGVTWPVRCGGQGLSQVYGFVRQSGGIVRLDSAPGRGTTVRLYLPRHGAVRPK